MSLNNILAISESLGINDQRFVGQMVSRNQKITTSELLTVVPFVFELRPMNYLRYSESRDVLNSLRIPDKALIQYLNFTGSGWQNYIEYQGQMTSGQIAACEWQTSSVAKTLVLGSLPSVDAATVLFEVGDFVQVGLYSYIVTAQVTRGGGATVSVPVHRNLLSAVSPGTMLVAGQYGSTVSMGGTVYTGITFQVILREYPTYTLQPITNDSYIQWNGVFKAFEAVL